MRELSEIRQDINRVDSAIRELFLLRMSLALEVAKTKAQSDDKIYKPDREAEIVEKRSAGMEEELQLKYVSLLQSMIRASREYQYSEILLSSVLIFKRNSIITINNMANLMEQSKPKCI